MNVTIVLAGNPNAGKTTLFNELTGARQHVGNYPGITVEKKQGQFVKNGNAFNVVDLPGTYSLAAYSLEEVVARNYLIDEKPDMVVNIVDASNLARNLYLSVQLMEMGAPVTIALNMMDMARSCGMHIDADKLSELLGVPVVPTVARTGGGKNELIDAVVERIKKPMPALPRISYGNDIDNALDKMEEAIQQGSFLTDARPARWVALKYLEQDEDILKMGRKVDPRLSNQMEQIVKDVSAHLKKTLNTYPEVMIADHRYGYINAILKRGVLKRSKDQNRLQTSDKIDKIVVNRFMGPLIMAAVIMGLYHFTFNYSEIPVAWFESFFSGLAHVAQTHLPPGNLRSLVVSGVINGVGGVLGFTPLIAFMFLGISALEDSGYLARVSFMLDRIFRYFGLHGGSVMAFITSGGIAGGCAVPGVMAARTLKSKQERLATLLTVPFMSCGAKLPVFALLIAAFFSRHEALIMFMITIVSWLGALLSAKLLRSTIIKGHSTPFIMELPPYRWPTFKGLFIHTWERTWQYIKKAGTIILGISILLWALMTFPGPPESTRAEFARQRAAVVSSASSGLMEEIQRADAGRPLSPKARDIKQRLTSLTFQEAEARLRYSIAGRVGSALEGVTRLAGFDWRTNIALIGGFAAKEVIVSTLGAAYSLGEINPEQTISLSKKLARSPSWNPAVALSLIFFTIFYAPCFVTVTCISRESGSWKWGLFSMAFNTVIAFILAVLAFQIGSLFLY